MFAPNQPPQCLSSAVMIRRSHWALLHSTEAAAACSLMLLSQHLGSGPCLMLYWRTLTPAMRAGLTAYQTPFWANSCSSRSCLSWSSLQAAALAAPASASKFHQEL